MANPALFKTLYRILSWTSIVGLVVTLALVLRKAPAPNTSFDPAAIPRVQQKFADAEQAKASGQPAQVQLDPTELNSYLAQSLDLQGASQPDGGTGPASTPGSGAAPVPGIAGADGATLADVQSSVKDVKVDMDGDIVKAYVVFDFHGKDLSLELDGHVGTQDGYLKFEPVAGKLGSLPATPVSPERSR